MKLTMLRIFFAAAVLVVSASATIIDNFNSPADQYVCVQTAPSGPPCGGVSAQNNNPATGLGADTIGGWRNLAASIASGSGDVQAYVNRSPASGVFEVSSSTFADPLVTVTYFGEGGAANLVASGENILHLRYRTDNGFTLNLNLGGTTLPILLTPGAPNVFQDLYISLVPWMSVANGNLTNVTSASFTFSGLGISSADGAIDVIETVVPEPMSFVMMGAGLLAIGALRLRKRA